jgi:hypothetical protein
LNFNKKLTLSNKGEKRNSVWQNGSKKRLMKRASLNPFETPVKLHGFIRGTSNAYGG